MKENTWYWENHIKTLDDSANKISKIKRIASEFRKRLVKLEKSLIFIQERCSYLKIDKLIALLSPSNQSKLDEQREILDRKIIFLK